MTDESCDMDELRAALTTAAPSRLLMVAHALRQNMSVDEVCALSHFDPWFVRQIKEIVDIDDFFDLAHEPRIEMRQRTNFVNRHILPQGMGNHEQARRRSRRQSGA